MTEPDYSIPIEPDRLVTVPAIDSVQEMLRDNEQRRMAWAFQVAGLDAASFAERARASSMDAAHRFCQAKHVTFEQRSGPLIATGHQPVLFHPGVWIKNFVVDRLSKALGGTGLNLVVDADAVEDNGLDVPTWNGHTLTISRRPVAHVPSPDVPFESIDPPDPARMAELCRTIVADLHTLPDKRASRAFGAFCDGLHAAERIARNLSELVTCARRNYEESAGTSYLELPGSAQAQSDEFLLFFLDIAEQLDRFHAAYNRCLDRYRATHAVRSPANPFPNLSINGPLVETPFWLMDASGMRATLWVKSAGDVSLVCHANGCKVELERGNFESNIAALRGKGAQIRPKALVFTLFNRMFVCDLFVHGMGGAKYDRVTDEIARAFYGADAPRYLAATATAWLPTGVDTPSADVLPELRRRLRMLEHNPERFADDATADVSTRTQLASLVEEKARLVEQITKHGADKKELGSKIRRINASLGELLRPVREATSREILAAERAESSRRVVQHREFPFCYWQPSEIAGLVDDAIARASGLRGVV